MARFYEYTEKRQVCDQVIRVYRERTGMWPGSTSIQRNWYDKIEELEELGLELGLELG